MKRRRSVEPKKSTSNNQLKISKFFHANPSIQNDAIVETSTIKSVKSFKVFDIYKQCC
jgi:hypothetical protein